MRQLALVVGPGRSGTSTMAGVLSGLGLDVPGEQVAADDTNPRGFYEPREIVELHVELLEPLGIGTATPGPDMAERARDLASAPRVRDRLRTLLESAYARSDDLVVKDPRAVWFVDAWRAVAGELGVTPRFVTMVRHPAEFVHSYVASYVEGGRPDRAEAVFRLGSWVNTLLVTEHATRDDDRVVVRYTDLVADWRASAARVARVTGLRLPRDPAEAAELDDFVDPTLHRHVVTFDDIEVTPALRDLGVRAWDLAQTLASDGAAAPVADALRVDYDAYHGDAWALTRHDRRLEVRRARRQLRRRLAEESAS